MDLDARIKAYRFVAYSAVTFSVVAVVSVFITLPMVYNYVHQVKRQVHSEVNFCKVLWPPISSIKNDSGICQGYLDRGPLVEGRPCQPYRPPGLQHGGLGPGPRRRRRRRGRKLLRLLPTRPRWSWRNSRKARTTRKARSPWNARKSRKRRLRSLRADHSSTL